MRAPSSEKQKFKDAIELQITTGCSADLSRDQRTFLLPNLRFSWCWVMGCAGLEKSFKESLLSCYDYKWYQFLLPITNVPNCRRCFSKLVRACATADVSRSCMQTILNVHGDERCRPRRPTNQTKPWLCLIPTDLFIHTAGPIPAELGELSALTVLNLSWNQLSGRWQSMYLR